MCWRDQARVRPDRNSLVRIREKERKRKMSKMQTLITAAVLFLAGRCHAEVIGAAASVRPDNSLIVDIQVTTRGAATQLFVTYWAAGIQPLVSSRVPVSPTGLTT